MTPRGACVPEAPRSRLCVGGFLRTPATQRTGVDPASVQSETAMTTLARLSSPVLAAPIEEEGRFKSVGQGTITRTSRPRPTQNLRQTPSQVR